MMYPPDQMQLVMRAAIAFLFGMCLAYAFNSTIALVFG